MSTLLRLFCALLCALPAWAQDVTLTARDGGVTIEGTLLSYDGEFYRLETIYGPLTLDGQGVTCAGPGCPTLEGFVADISLSGSAVMGDVLIPALIRAFARGRGLDVLRDVTDDSFSVFELRDMSDTLQGRMRLRISTTDEGFADLVAGEADLAMAVREPTAEELALAQAAGQGDLNRRGRARVVALDGLIPVGPRDGAGPGLTPAALVERIERGGPSVHLLEPAHGIHQVLTARLNLPPSLTPVTRHGRVSDLVDTVASSANGLGVGLWSDLGDADPLVLRGGCGFGVQATSTALKAEDYPLTVPLLLYSAGRRLPLLAREFLAFLDSSTAELVISRAGFVDQGVSQVPLANQGTRLANAISAAGSDITLQNLQDMVQGLQGATRLTPTFRFRGGSTQLDIQSAGNQDRLARLLSSGLYDGREVIFVGFSDGAGDAAANKALSQQRAEAVRAAVRAEALGADFNQVTLSVLAFGEALPIACDQDAWGRDVNRRVEVWLR